MLTFPLTPDVEVRQKLQDNYKLSIGFNSLSETDKNTLLDFYLDTAKDDFYYWTSNKYTIYEYNSYFTVKNTDFVIAKDKDTLKDNLYVNDTISTTIVDPSINPTTITLSDTINAPITCFIEQQFYSGDVEYLHIFNSTISIKVRQANSNLLILTVKTPIKAYAKSIALKKLEYDIYGNYYNYIVYAISIKSDRIVLGHNGNYVEIDLSGSYDMSNLEIVSTKNMNNFILANKYADGELLKGFAHWIGNTITISVYSESVSLSKMADTYIYGNPRYIASFLDEVVYLSRQNNSTYSLSVNLIGSY